MSSITSSPDATDFALFPTRLVTIQFADTEALNADLCGLFQRHGELADGFNMHPDALNLLRLADSEPGIAKLREMFLEGVKRWLAVERVAEPEAVDLVLFSNCADHGEFTLVHNHSADLVEIYYVRTAQYDRPAVYQPDSGDNYFEPDDGVLVLHDPRFNANMAAVCNRDHVKVFPRPGLMLIFPGYLWHSVLPHGGEFRRLSFSMNIRLHWPAVTTAQRHALT